MKRHLRMSLGVCGGKDDFDVEAEVLDDGRFIISGRAVNEQHAREIVRGLDGSEVEFEELVGAL